MKPIFNRAPLTPNALAPLPLGSIRPEGWLKARLDAHRRGMDAWLDAVLPPIGPSGVAAADAEAVAQAMDSLVPLAWTLDDEALKARCAGYVDWLVASQREDGWFGPAGNADYWPLMLLLRALRQFFMATGDKRVLVLMDRFFKYQYQNLNAHPLKDWAVARGGENMEIALWLYNLTGQKHLIELCRRLRAQTLDWTNYFHTFANTVPMSKSLKWDRLKEALDEEKNEPLEGEKRPYFRTQYHLSQGVNIAMGLKTPGVINLFKSGFKEQGGFRFGWEKLMKHHGLANGMFTCDGHLSGNSPTQGTDARAVAELMATMEALIGLGDFNADYADILEKAAYNALPAMFSPASDAFQRLQQVNQVRLSPGTRKWYNEEADGNLLTRRSEDPRRAIALEQAWPKFTASLWYGTADGGLQAVSYAPCQVRATLGGVPVRLRVSGSYPFGQTIKLEVSVKQPCEFPVYLRVPSWARQPMIFLPDGEIMQVRAGEVTCVRRRWRTGDTVRLELPTMPRVTRWYHQSGAVELGPLLMAFAPGAMRPDGEEAWQLTARDPWNWALVRDEPMKAVYGEECQDPFGADARAVTVLAKAVPVDWPMDGESCSSVPMVPRIDPAKAHVIELQPYGSAFMRIAEFPLGRVDGRQEP